MEDYTSWVDEHFAADGRDSEGGPEPYPASSAAPLDAAQGGAALLAESEGPSIEQMLCYAVDHCASDLHLTTGVPPMVRVNGELSPIPGMSPLTLVRSTMSEQQLKSLEGELEVDFSFGRPGIGRFRVNAFHERGDVSAALRRIPDEPPHLEDLGLPPAVAGLAELRTGLVLVTGPTGTGKSTTLAALVDKINRERCEHIITIEDPIEFVHVHKKSVVQQREVEQDTRSFARALKSALREDPNVILIGEMRDLETIAAAVSAAETGHLVLASLHTGSAVQSIDRIIDVFPPHQQSQIRLQLSSSLQAVLAQRLIPTVEGPRVCAVELLLASPAVRNLIREGKTHNIEQAMQSGIEDGMVLFDMNLARLVRESHVTRETALSYANDPKGFADRLGW